MRGRASKSKGTSVVQGQGRSSGCEALRSAAEVAEVTAAVARYQDAKTELERAACAGVAALRARRAARRGQRR